MTMFLVSYMTLPVILSPQAVVFQTVIFYKFFNRGMVADNTSGRSNPSVFIKFPPVYVDISSSSLNFSRFQCIEYSGEENSFTPIRRIPNALVAKLNFFLFGNRFQITNLKSRVRSLVSNLFAALVFQDFFSQPFLKCLLISKYGENNRNGPTYLEPVTFSPTLLIYILFLWAISPGSLKYFNNKSIKL